MKRKYPMIDIARTGQNIKQIMKKRGMTVKDIQEFLELNTPQSIYHWFDGRNLPTTDNLYALSELFHLPVDALLKGNRGYRPVSADKAAYRRMFMYYKKFLRFQVG